MEYPTGSGTIHSTPQYSQSQQNNISSAPHQSIIYNNNTRYSTGTGPIVAGTGNGPSSEYMNYRHSGYTSGPPQSQSPYNMEYCAGGLTNINTRPTLYTSTVSGPVPRQIFPTTVQSHISEMTASHSQSQHHPTPTRYDQSSQNWSMQQQQQGFSMSHSHSSSPPNHVYQAFYDNQVNNAYTPLQNLSSGTQYNNSYVSGSGVPSSQPPHYSAVANNSTGVVGTRYNQPLTDVPCHPQHQQTSYGTYRPVYQGLDQSLEKAPPQHWILPSNQHSVYNSVATQQINQGADVRHQPLTEPVSPEPLSTTAMSGSLNSIKVGRPGSGDSNSGGGNRQVNQANGVSLVEDERPLSRISEPLTPRPNASTSVGPNSSGMGSNSSTPAPGPPQANSPMPQQTSSHQYFGHSQNHAQQAAAPPYGLASRPPSRNAAYVPSGGGGKPVYSALPFNASQQQGISNSQMNYPHSVVPPSQPLYQNQQQQRPTQPYSGDPSNFSGAYFPSNSQVPLIQPIPHSSYSASHQPFSYGPSQPAPQPLPSSIMNQGAVSGSQMMGPPPSIDQYRGSPSAPLRRPPPSNLNSVYPTSNNGGVPAFETPSSVINGATITTSIIAKASESSDFQLESRRAKNQCVNKPTAPASVNMTFSDDNHSNANLASPCHSSTHDDDSLLSSPMTPATTGTNSGCPTPFGTPSSIVNNPAAALLTATGQHKLFIMGDEPERRVWVENYLAFMEEIGRPLTNLPQVAKHPLDLYRLYFAVRERGGVMEVVKAKRWKEISQYVNINASASAAYTLRKNYMKYMVDFECRFDRAGADPRPLIAQIESMSAKKKKSATSSGNTPSSATLGLSSSIQMTQEVAVGGLASPKSNGVGPPLQSGSSPSPVNGIIAHPSASGQRSFPTHPGYSPSPSVVPPSQDLIPSTPLHNGITMHRTDVPLPVGFSAPQLPAAQHSWQSQQHNVYSPATGCQESHLPQALSGGPLHNHMAISAPLQPIQGQYHASGYSSCPPAPSGFRPVMHSSYDNIQKDSSMPANHQIRQLQQLVHNQVPLPVTAPPTSISSEICTTSPLIAGQLQQRPALKSQESSILASSQRSSALIGMLTSNERFGPPVRPDWPGYGPSRTLSLPCPPNRLEHNAGAMPPGLRPHHFGHLLRNGPHDVGMPPTLPHHLQNVYPPEAQMRNRFDVGSIPSQYQQQLALHHQMLYQNMGGVPPGSMIPHRMLSHHAMAPMFDPKTVEGIQIFDVKRFRLTPKDIGPIDPWRMYMALKSGLACEGTRALDTLNVVLADTDALSYMSLFRLPGFLETLVELWRRSLIELFPQGRFEELELSISGTTEKKHSCDRVSSCACSDEQPTIDEYDFNFNDYEVLLDRVRRLRCTNDNFTFRSRCGRRVKLELRKARRKGVMSLNLKNGENFSSGMHVWRHGQGDTTSHIVLCGEKRKRIFNSIDSEDEKSSMCAAKKMCRNLFISDVEAKGAAEQVENDFIFRSHGSRFCKTNDVFWRCDELNQRVLNLWPNEESGQLLARCCVLSNVLRSLSFLSANETELCAHPGLLRLIAYLLLFLQSKEDGSTPAAGGVSLREDALVLLTNVAGQLSLDSLPDAVLTPLLDALLKCLCDHATWEATHRLALECLARLSVREANVDLILATRPWKRLEHLMDLLCQHLLTLVTNGIGGGGFENSQVTRELALSTLSYIVRGGSGSAALYVARANSALIPLLLEFIEATETAAIRVAQTQGISALREQPELMGTSLDMLRRAAATLQTLAQLPENASLLRIHEARLLLLVMSQILDQQVASMLADVLYLASKDNPPKLQIKSCEYLLDAAADTVASAVQVAVKEEISLTL